ncbi:hypothetical protein, partial [Arthrobacter sp. 3Tela_A]|uniref:hypothetical protein n=1 Tax=Arthrobacter sp. 3Tela_A TaxID=3093743 RepID=UPI003BB79F96
QTTGTSGLLRKTIPNRELSFLFAPLWCFTSIFHPDRFSNSANSEEFQPNRLFQPIRTQHPVPGFPPAHKARSRSTIERKLGFGRHASGAS